MRCPWVPIWVMKMLVHFVHPFFFHDRVENPERIVMPKIFCILCIFATSYSLWCFWQNLTVPVLMMHPTLSIAKHFLFGCINLVYLEGICTCITVHIKWITKEKHRFAVLLSSIFGLTFTANGLFLMLQSLIMICQNVFIWSSFKYEEYVQNNGMCYEHK